MVNPDGTVTYTPDAGFVGTDSFTFRACDPDGACDTATITINVADGGPIPGGSLPPPVCPSRRWQP